MDVQFNIVGLGEALFDVFPGRQILGGAPLNMAVHAHQLGAAHGGRGVVASRVGQDDLGSRVREELTARGMPVDYLQFDPDHTTGKVFVNVDDQGQPDYEIAEDVAWDWIQSDPDLNNLARRCDAVCFSSLAQRHSQSRNAIWRFLGETGHAVRMFDLTLRKDYYDQRTLRRSCELCTVIKLNQEELEVLSRELALSGESADDRAGELLRRFNLRLVVLTRGAEGTVLFTSSQRLEGESVSYPPGENADSVGAGDACAAAILVGLVLRMPLPKVLELANHAGAYVASVQGATPPLPLALLDMVKL